MPNTIDMARTKRSGDTYTNAEAAPITPATMYKAAVAGMKKDEETGQNTGTVMVAIQLSNALPWEILQSIFRLLYQPDISKDAVALDTNEDPITSNAHPAFVLMQVCSVWRHVVLDTPEVWHFVCADNSPRGLSLATRWLSRARHIPRTLIMDVRCGGQAVAAVVRLISQFAFRRLRINTFYPMDFTGIPVESFLPTETFALKAHGSYDVDFKGLPFSCHALTNLSHLSISGPVNTPRFHQSTSCRKLRRLDLYCNRMTNSDGLAILRQLPTLEHFTLLITVDNGWHTSPVRNVTAPELSFLDIRFQPSGDAAALLDNLITPKLKSLKLNFDFLSKSLDCRTTTLCQFMSHCRAYIETLMIYGTLSSLSISSLLDCMPSLRRLQLRTASRLYESTARRIASGHLGPRLEILDVCLKSSEHRTVGLILDMIESRRQTARSPNNPHAVSPFKRVWIQFSDVTGESQSCYLSSYEERVERLKKDGILHIV